MKEKIAKDEKKRKSSDYKASQNKAASSKGKKRRHTHTLPTKESASESPGEASGSSSPIYVMKQPSKKPKAKAEKS